MKNVIIIIILLFLISCTYSVYSSGLPHLKTISVNSFVNKSSEYELDEEIYIQLSNKFTNDGRLSLVTMSPDCILEGEILDYSNEVLSYAGSNVDAYKVKILFAITFTDLVKNKIIWQNSSLLLTETYSAIDTNINYKTEIAAQQKIINDLFDIIIKNSLEKW